MNPNSFLVVALFLASVLHVTGQSAAFSYQGRLNRGSSLANGLYDFQFGLFDASSGGLPLAAVAYQTAVPVHEGLFTVTLNFGESAFSGESRWLEVSVRTNQASEFVTLTPRQSLTASPYAITARQLSGSIESTQLVGSLPSAALAGDYSSLLAFSNESNRYQGDGSALHFGAGVGYCDLPCYWNLNGNLGTTSENQFIGTKDNIAVEIRVNSQRAFRFEPTTNSPNLIGGFAGNSVASGTTGNTISGGGTLGRPNRISLPETNHLVGVYPEASTIGGGSGNQISRSGHSTIGGGVSNAIIAQTTFSGSQSNDTICGGAFNAIIDAESSSIVGGTVNVIRGDDVNRVWDSIISGGRGNSIRTSGDDSGGSTISGGNGNLIWTAGVSTIAGGNNNSIFFYSGGATISGGGGNSIGYDSDSTTIAGGAGNTIGRQSSRGAIGGGIGNIVRDESVAASISGGQSNIVTGELGTVPGGFGNEASAHAFAAGTRAKAVHPGSFVWASGNNNDFPSSTSNRVHFYAAGGMEVAFGGQDVDGHGSKWLEFASQEPGRVINAYNGAYLSEGGVWTDSSDRNAKQDFAPVNSQEILTRVASLPLNEWSYRAETNAVRHIGPTAQDFHAAFGLGADDKHIAALDSSGVALAAVQGLQMELQAKQAQIDRLNQRLEELEKRLGGSNR